jgi:hypothetical protein
MNRHALTGWLSLLPIAIALLAPVRAHAFDSVNASGHSLTATGPAAACQAWQIVPVPIPASDHVALAAAAASSSSDVWSVGYVAPASQTSLATLTEHFDGTRWRIVHSPTLGADARLRGVAVISPADAWAVGDGQPLGSPGAVPLLLRWNGAQWVKLRHGAFPGAGTLSGVSATSGSDVWAVGTAQTGTTSQTLIEHFDGTVWSVVPSPSPGTSAQLLAVTAISATDAWAVGTSVLPSQANLSLLEHWDGVRWSVVPAPDQGQILEGVAASSPRDIWAVGLGLTIRDSLADHFDGTTWTSVPAATPSIVVNQLLGVAMASTSDAWSVGAFYDHGLHMMIQHWDGSAWSVSFHGDLGSLAGIATVPGGGAWTVGSLGQGTAVSPFAAFHC